MMEAATGFVTCFMYFRYSVNITPAKGYLRAKTALNASYEPVIKRTRFKCFLKSGKEYVEKTSAAKSKNFAGTSFCAKQ